MGGTWWAGTAGDRSDVEEIVAAWWPYLARLGDGWRGLVDGVTPKQTGCGLLYELANPIGRAGEDFAVADMRALAVGDPHCHLGDETEIYVVLQGTGTVVVGGEAFEVGPEDVVVTPPGTAHYTVPHDELVLGVVSSPPCDPANYVPLRESDTSVGFDAATFTALARRDPDITLDSLLRTLADDLQAWATVLLVPNHRRTLLAARARFRLPLDWAVTGNRLDSGSMNARVFRDGTELVANGIDEDGPPTDRPVSRHRMTAAAVVPVPGVGTLEALADVDGYLFDDVRLRRLRAAAAEVGAVVRG